MIEQSIVRIGVIADTHGLFDPALIEHFAGMIAILHAGDIGNLEVIRQLERIASVVAVSGNVDEFEENGFPRSRVIRFAGVMIGIRHILFERGKLTSEAKGWMDKEQPDVCVFGHSHRPTIDQYGGIILFNPGSAGPRRFSLPRGVGAVTIHKSRIMPELIRLKDSVRSVRRKTCAPRAREGSVAG